MLLKPDLKHPQAQPVFGGISTRPGEKGWGHQGSECSGDISSDYRVSFFCLFKFFSLLYHFLKPSKRRMIIKERETDMTHDSTRRERNGRQWGMKITLNTDRRKQATRGKAISVPSSHQRGT